jgi:hypothetical protein
MSSSDRVAQLYPQALGSLFVAFYDSQGYGGGILTRLPPHGYYIMSGLLILTGAYRRNDSMQLKRILSVEVDIKNLFSLHAH